MQKFKQNQVAINCGKMDFVSAEYNYMGFSFTLTKVPRILPCTVKTKNIVQLKLTNIAYIHMI